MRRQDRACVVCAGVQGDPMSVSGRSQVLVVAVAFIVVFMAGCGSSSSSKGSAQLRIMNASTNQQSINLMVDNSTVQTGIVSMSASAYAAEPVGNHALQIEAYGTTTSLVSQSASLAAGSYYTVLATPSSAGSSSLNMTLLTDDNSAPSAGNFKLRIINAAPNFGNLDAYVGAPGLGTTGSPAISNVAFQAASSYLNLPAGNYEVYFTKNGQQVIYVDSGQFTFASGQIRTLVLMDNFGGGFTSALLADLN